MAYLDADRIKRSVAAATRGLEVVGKATDDLPDSFSADYVAGRRDGVTLAAATLVAALPEAATWRAELEVELDREASSVAEARRRVDVELARNKDRIVVVLDDEAAAVDLARVLDVPAADLLAALDTFGRPLNKGGE